MDEIVKDKLVSMAGTLGFHVLVILLLLFYIITPSSEHRWTEPMEGIPVMFGNVPNAGGDDEPSGKGNNGNPAENTLTEAPNEAAVAPTQQPTASVVNNQQNTLTQDMEETVAAKEAEKATEQKKRQETERKAALEAEQKRNISNSVAGLFGNGDSSGSRGNTSGTGTQGVPTGNADYGKTSGVGGWGSYDLGGRGLGRGGLIKPNYTANDYGKVVVNIVVDPQGNVIHATIGKGTNTTSSQLKEESLRASRRTKFNPVSTPGNQNGTITYTYNLN
jgi:TonB family protein